MCGRHHFCSQRATCVIGVSVCMRCTGLRAWHRSAIGRRAPTSAAEQVCFAPEQLARIVCLSLVCRGVTRRGSGSASSTECTRSGRRLEAANQPRARPPRPKLGKCEAVSPRPPDAREPERRRRLETGARRRRPELRTGTPFCVSPLARRGRGVGAMVAVAACPTRTWRGDSQP